MMSVLGSILMMLTEAHPVNQALQYNTVNHNDMCRISSPALLKIALTPHPVNKKRSTKAL